MQFLDEFGYTITVQNQPTTCDGEKLNQDTAYDIIYLSRCRDKCDKQETCNHFVYNNYGHCHLYSECESRIKAETNGTLFHKEIIGSWKIL